MLRVVVFLLLLWFSYGQQVSSSCYVPPGRESCGPYYVIVGSMKCGTTSLFTYLQSHPQVLGLQENAKLNNRPILGDKEVRFFLDPLYTSLVSKHDLHGALDLYYDLFPTINPSNNSNEITGEASPMYVCPGNIANRVKKAYPFGKIIWMMRNPVSRAYSDYWFRKLLSMKEDDLERVTSTSDNGHFAKCAKAEIAVLHYCNITTVMQDSTLEVIDKFRECVREQEKSVARGCDAEIYGDMCLERDEKSHCKATGMVRNGIYYYQLLEWLDLFGDDQLLVIKSEEFYENTEQVMNRVTKFLGLEPIDWSEITKSAFNIVTPNTASAVGHQLITDNHSMGIGASGVENTASYPPMEHEIQEMLSSFYHPYNQMLKGVFPLMDWD